MTALTVCGLGKAFRQYRTELHRVLTWFGMSPAPVAEHWVVRDISFSVGQGEAVGIIGQNGAGKSTLLKLITGTMRPTTGSVSVSGRVAAILELGMGFNPDLTARQNVVHGAGLMGHSRDEIEAKLPEIEAFAEVGEFFDRPVRIFSSGMQVRVAFALATAFRPEILIVDEALSVGDAYFQHKSFERIRTMKRDGTALLLVSHDMAAIQNICDRSILVDRGCIVRDGPPVEVADYYNALIASREGADIRLTKLEDGRLQVTSGNGLASVVDAELLDAAGQPVRLVDVGQPVELRVRVHVKQDLETLVLGYAIKDRLGQVMHGTNTWYSGQVLSEVAAGRRLRYRIALPMNLGPGTYSVSLALTRTRDHLAENYEWRDYALMFEVANFARRVQIGSAWIESEIGIADEADEAAGPRDAPGPAAARSEPSGVSSG